MEKIDKDFHNNLEEVYIVLEKLNLIKELPQKFIDYIKENKNNEYEFKYEEEKELIYQKISEESKKILTIIYQDFFCTKEEKEKLNEILIKNEEKKQKELNEKYEYEKIFQQAKKIPDTSENKPQNEQLIEYKESIFHKIIRKIKQVLK